MLYLRMKDRIIYTPGMSVDIEYVKRTPVLSTFDKDGKLLRQFELTNEQLESLTVDRVIGNENKN